MRKGKMLSKLDREKLENLDQLRDKFKQKLQKMKDRYLNSPKFPERNWEQHGQLINSLPKTVAPLDPNRVKKKRKNRRKRPLFILSSSSESSDYDYEDHGSTVYNTYSMGMNIHEKLVVKIEGEEHTSAVQAARARARGLYQQRRVRTSLGEPSSPEQTSNSLPYPHPDNEAAFEEFLERARRSRQSSNEPPWKIVLKPLCVNPATNLPRNVIVFRKKHFEPSVPASEAQQAPACVSEPQHVTSELQEPQSDPKDASPSSAPL
jgi:hypothetical protein